MRNYLKNLVSIQSGIYSQFGQTGAAIYLQANNFNAFGDLKLNIKPNLVLNWKTEKHILKEGDVLFAAKGVKNFAVIIKGNMGACVASSTFLVLRVKDEQRNNLVPEFLVWFLNHHNTLSYLRSKAIGSTMPSITKNVLEDAEINLPDLKTQRTIIAIDALRRKEHQLKLKLEKLKEMQVQQLLLNLTTNKISIHGK